MTSPLQVEGTEEIAVALGAGLRGAHAGENVLLDGDPALIVLGSEEIADSAEIDFALTEFAIDAVPNSLEIVPVFGAGAGGDFWVIILEMDVPDAVEIFLETLQGVAAAEPIMSGVETESDEIRVGQFQKCRNLVRGFDITRAVMMKGGDQPLSSTLGS